MKVSKVGKKIGKHLTDIQRASIVTAHNFGESISDLARTMKVAYTTIQRAIDKYKATQEVGRKLGSGRPRKTTKKQDRKIIRAISKNRKITSPEILVETDIQNVSDKTIRRRIKEDERFKSYWATKKPFINGKNRKKRVAWCMAHRNWKVKQWRQHLFSDESPFVLRFNGKIRVWRMYNERYNPECTIGSVKHDRKIMVWGCFSAAGIGKLHRVDGIMRKEQYINILKNQMLPSARKLFKKKSWSFQQDNDPKHTAKLTKKWFIDNKIDLLDWPSQSPDLNPIENLWSILDHNLSHRKPQNEEELFDILENGWKDLSLDLLKRLSDSMINRIEAVIKAKGYATKY
jgi:transposase